MVSPKEISKPEVEPQQFSSKAKDPIPQPKDLDYVFWGFWINLGLVLATLIIAIFSVVQASAAKTNAKAADDAAKASQKQVEVIVSKERARLAVIVTAFLASKDQQGRCRSRVFRRDEIFTFEGESACS